MCLKRQNENNFISEYIRLCSHAVKEKDYKMYSLIVLRIYFSMEALMTPQGRVKCAEIAGALLRGEAHPAAADLLFREMNADRNIVKFKLAHAKVKEPQAYEDDEKTLNKALEQLAKKLSNKSDSRKVAHSRQSD